MDDMGGFPDLTYCLTSSVARDPQVLREEDFCQNLDQPYSWGEIRRAV